MAEERDSSITESSDPDLSMSTPTEKRDPESDLPTYRDISWLECQPSPAGEPYSRFDHLVLRERPGSRGNILPQLAALAVEHHTHPRSVAFFQSHGFSKLAEYIATRLPSNHKARMGNFGEVLATEHLRQCHGVSFPVFKLRFTDNPQMPARGEDAVGFLLDADGRITEVCIGEAKTIAEFRKKVVTDAHVRLRDGCHPYPVTLGLIAEILRAGEKHTEADAVEEVMVTLSRKEIPRQNWIFLITGDAPDKPFSALEDESETDPLLTPLTCVQLHLEDVKALVDAIFTAAIPASPAA